jgi:transcription initiation factor IIE alpha subunit
MNILLTLKIFLMGEHMSYYWIIYYWVLFKNELQRVQKEKYQELIRELNIQRQKPITT